MDTRTPTAHLPCVRVTQPRGGILDARIRWWSRDEHGAWWAVVEYTGWTAGEEDVYVMAVPAESVASVTGEVYSTVERRG
jgi:hypothetical protein